MAPRDLRVDTVLSCGVSDLPESAAVRRRIFPGRSAFFWVPKKEKV
jgi:hypothetical protein